MYIVYKTVNTVNDRYYIGIHRFKNVDEYLGSGIKLNFEIKKLGQNKFTRQTLFKFINRFDALDKEKEILSTCLNDINCLNISPGGWGVSAKGHLKHSEESREKIRQKAMGRKYSQEVNYKKANWCRNKTYSEIYKDNENIEKTKRSESLKKQYSEGTRISYFSKIKQCV